VNRLTVRVRLALASALAMAALLAAAGAFVYCRLDADLSAALDRELRQRAQDLAVGLRPGRSLDNLAGVGLVERGESFAQVVGSDGRVVASTRSLGTGPLLSLPELDRARRSPVFLDRPSVPGLDEPARLLATPMFFADRRSVLVVGATGQNRLDALASLRTQLLLGGPLTLLVATAGAYLLAGAALRPVEAMRRRAAGITAGEPGRRLPLPAGDDELARLGATLNDMLARLEAGMERERSFVADASHELRTPLALLKTELELALRRPRSAAELRRAITSAAQDTDRLTRLAEDLLLIARADQGRLPVRYDAVDATAVLDRITGEFETAAPGRVVRVSRDGGAPLLPGDPRWLEQALRNLVDNALRHGTGAVRLSIVDFPDAVELHVTDDGPGFGAAYLPHAFERFSRADAGRSSGGAGLGLSIVDAIARAHGGAAHAADRPEGGADVWLVLPKRPPTPR
jgi:two-component system OmpR family sensor kinase